MNGTYMKQQHSSTCWSICEVVLVQGSDSLAVLLSYSLLLCITVPHTDTCTPPYWRGLGNDSVWSSQFIPICYNQLLQYLWYKHSFMVTIQTPPPPDPRRNNKLILTKCRQKASYLSLEPSCVVQQFRHRSDAVLHVFILLSRLYLKMMWLFLCQFPPWWPRMSNTRLSCWIILWSEVC